MRVERSRSVPLKGLHAVFYLTDWLNGKPEVNDFFLARHMMVPCAEPSNSSSLAHPWPPTTTGLEWNGLK